MVHIVNLRLLKVIEVCGEIRDFVAVFWLSLLFGAIILEDGNDRYQAVTVLEVAVPGV